MKDTLKILAIFIGLNIVVAIFQFTLGIPALQGIVTLVLIVLLLMYREVVGVGKTMKKLLKLVEKLEKKKK